MSAASGPGRTGAAFTIADRYRVLARVGLGGTAVVYRCIDDHTARVVAVKVLRTSGPQIPEAAGRFRREARLAASLSHRHIVRVLDYGYSMAPAMGVREPWISDDDQPVPYVAMEYVFGPNLKELVRKIGPLPLPWVWRLGDQLCAALAAAHDLGVVHRDVKPQNVMLVDSHLELVAKLTDFGIARQVGGDYTTLTVTGQVLGTPDYLSPEQVMGEPGDPASDLYSLGIVLYELLTGHLPFEADTPLAAASRRMVADPPPPSRFRPDVPSSVEDVVLWVLQRDPTARPASARDLAGALLWSRAHAPATDEVPAGAWLVGSRAASAQATPGGQSPAAGTPGDPSRPRTPSGGPGGIPRPATPSGPTPPPPGGGPPPGGQAPEPGGGGHVTDS
jgi:eukaryotic-like serine/threonine-protein kinase